MKNYIYFANPLMDGLLIPYDGEYNPDDLNSVRRCAVQLSKEDVIVAVFYLESIIEKIWATDIQPVYFFYKGEAFPFEGIS